MKTESNQSSDFCQDLCFNLQR